VLAVGVALAGPLVVSPRAEAAVDCSGRWAPSNGKFIESYERSSGDRA